MHGGLCQDVACCRPAPGQQRLGQRGALFNRVVQGQHERDRGRVVDRHNAGDDPASPFRIHYRAAEGTDLVTGWITL